MISIQQQQKNNNNNKIIIISNREVLNYRQRQHYWEKHKLHDKQGQTRKGPGRQRKHQYH